MSDARATGSWLVADEVEAPAWQPVAEAKKKEPIPGFYAGTAKEVLPPPRNRRKPVLLAIGLVGVVAAGVGLAVTAGGDDEPTAANAPSAPSATVAPSTTAAPASTEPASIPPEGAEGSESTATTALEVAPPPPGAPPSGEVLASEVVEVTDPGWYVSENRFGSYGFVVENTSDEALGSFVVRVKAYDLAGEVISGLDAWTHVIGTMQPYQRLVVADELHNEGMAANGISRLEVEVSELSDDPASGGRTSRPPVPDGTVAVGDIERTESLVRTRVTYRAASGYDVPLDANAYLVFRDAEGAIVGGASSFVDLPARGTVTGDFEVRNEIVSPDTTTVEVYVIPRLPL